MRNKCYHSKFMNLYNDIPNQSKLLMPPATTPTIMQLLEPLATPPTSFMQQIKLSIIATN